MFGRHYLDHASTSPLRPAAVAAICEWAERLGSPDGAGDPGRVHEEGRAAREAIEMAREQVASLAGVEPIRVVFTSGATEAANTAIASACAASGGGPVVCAGVEHSSVREAALRAGPVAELPVDGRGTIDIDALASVLASGAALVNCQWANHEVGTIQPVHEISALCVEAGVPLHVDAAAAFSHVPADLDALGASYVSVSSHKMGGPTGVGALVLGRGVRLRPMIVGGSEERDRRAGSENLLGIIGFGAAAGQVMDEGSLPREAVEAARYCSRLAASATAVEGVELLGPTEAARRLPHIVCVSVGGVLGEAVLLALDRAGIAAHSGSACSSEVLEPSPVLAAMGVDPDRSLRLSVGWSTTDHDIAAFEAAFPLAVAELRSLAQL